MAPGDKQVHTFSFAAMAGGTYAILVIQSGDGAGNGAATRGVVTTQGVPDVDDETEPPPPDTVRVKAGETHAAKVVALSATNTLSVTQSSYRPPKRGA